MARQDDDTQVYTICPGRRVYHDRLYTKGKIELTADEAEPLLELGAIEQSISGIEIFEAGADAGLSLEDQFAELVGGRAHTSLTEADLFTPTALHLATDEAIEGLPHVGRATVGKIRSFLDTHRQPLGLAALDAALESGIIARAEARAPEVATPTNAKVETGTGAGSTATS